MEATKFDDFIKLNTENDLPVPTELNWENMNFNLPPEKRKRRILFWMLFFLAGALVIGSGLWYVSQRGNTQRQPMAKKTVIDIQNQHSKINLHKEDIAVDVLPSRDAGVNDVTRNKNKKQETINNERLSRGDIIQQQDAGENSGKSENGKN